MILTALLNLINHGSDLNLISDPILDLFNLRREWQLNGTSVDLLLGVPCFPLLFDLWKSLHRLIICCSFVPYRN